MMTMTVSNLIKRFRAFLADQSASMSIEMVIVIPLLLFATTGGIAYWNAFNSNSRTAKVAYTLTDIMSRHTLVDNVDMAYLYNLQNKMLPNSVLKRRMRISSICFEDGQFQVMWSYSVSGTDVQTLPVLEAADVPIDLMPDVEPQDSVILVELYGTWSPRFLNVGLDTMDWTNRLVTRPRFVKFIAHSDLNGANICPDSTT